ncbi:MAG: dihydropteroate synthase, partial [Acidimicrobiales bacterium]
MGVLNVTPDSFSDGGRWLDPGAAVAHGLQLAAEGADVVDVGGESTRPGAKPVPAEEEMRRVLPVIEALAGEVRVSVDTRKAAVARAAVAAGATIIN